MASIGHIHFPSIGLDGGSCARVSFLSGLVNEELQGLGPQLFQEDQVQALVLISTHLLKMDLTPVLLLPKLLQMVSMALHDLPHTIFHLVGISKLFTVLIVF